MSFTKSMHFIVVLVVIPLLATGCGEEVDTIDSDEQLMSLARASLSQIEGELALEGLTGACRSDSRPTRHSSYLRAEHG